ncbi:MAG: 3',5'-cyclic-nucleotide phosphodiesterase [Myxococcales bacterium]|nr:3',5'-cyclic-nucleotide phosphodiesterase [Myxococcales bacterium]
MELRVLGCHGGESPRHRTTSFLIDERLALDAGALTSRLELAEQGRLEFVLVTHSHLDHVRDLATLADNRCQLGHPPLSVCGTRETLDSLRRHFFNDRLWPDFTRIPSPTEPTIVYRELALEAPTLIGRHQVTAVAVSHTVDTCGFLVDDGKSVIAVSGDTGPTDRLFEVLNQTANLRALLIEVSFPNGQQHLASASGHHTPQTLAADLRKLNAPADLPTMLYHMKPPCQAEIERECAKLARSNFHVLALDDRFVF